MTETPPKSTRTQKAAWACVVVAVGAAIVFGGQIWGGGAEGEGTAPAEPSEPSRGRLVDFACVERSGKAMRTSDLRGRFVVADFIFTSCEATCPRLAKEMAKVQAAFAKDDSVRIVSFSVDPDRDAPAVLAKYAADKGADPVRWLFVRSAKADLKKLMCDELRVASADEAMFHSDRFVLFDPAGEARGFYRPLEDKDWQAQLVGDVERLRGAAH